MAKGLDVGTMNITCAQRSGDRIRYKQQRNAFVEVEYSEVAEQMLERSDVLFIKNDDRVFIVGEDALNFANIFNTETHRPMSAGIFSRSEKRAIPMVQLMVDRLLGKPDGKSEDVYFNVPANPVDAELDTLYHQKTLHGLIDRLGFEPHPINEGMAVVYDKMSDQNFTGLGISWGAGMTNICLSYYAVPVLQFSVARGGDWIDKQVSQATGTPVDKVTASKEKGVKIDWKTEIGGLEGALSIYYENLVDYVVDNIAREVKKKNVEEGLTIPCASTGGTSQAEGFEELLLEKLDAADLPFEVDRVLKSRNPVFSVVKGDLVAALAEEDGK